jgi:hypothetical protein
MPGLAGGRISRSSAQLLEDRAVQAAARRVLTDVVPRTADGTVDREAVRKTWGDAQ